MDLYLEFIKNSYNSIVKGTTQFKKIGKESE